MSYSLHLLYSFRLASIRRPHALMHRGAISGRRMPCPPGSEPRRDPRGVRQSAGLETRDILLAAGLLA